MLQETVEYTMVVCYDAEEAFDNATFDSVCPAAKVNAVDGTIIRRSVPWYLEDC